MRQCLLEVIRGDASSPARGESEFDPRGDSGIGKGKGEGDDEDRSGGMAFTRYILEKGDWIIEWVVSANVEKCNDGALESCIMLVSG